MKIRIWVTMISGGKQCFPANTLLLASQSYGARFIFLSLRSLLDLLGKLSLELCHLLGEHFVAQLLLCQLLQQHLISQTFMTMLTANFAGSFSYDASLARSIRLRRPLMAEPSSLQRDHRGIRMNGKNLGVAQGPRPMVSFIWARRHIHQPS